MAMMWYGPKVVAEIRREIGKRVRAAAISLRDHIRKKVSVVHPSVWDKRRRKKRRSHGKKR